MDRQDTAQESVTHGWAARARRRWPLLAIGVVILIAAAWGLTRRKAAEPETPAPADAGAATVADSIVRLDTAAQRMAGIETMVVSSSAGGVLTVNGTITYDANRVSVIASRVEGRITSVRADLGQTVAAGTTLAVVESPEVAQIRGELERARVNLDAARRNYEREKRLFEQSITAQKELLQAEAEFRSVESDYSSALSRLRAIGATAGTGAAFGLVTPVSGTVVERNASPGQLVGPATDVFTVADLAQVWITVDVYEADLPRIRTGATATVLPTALPNESFTGRVTYAGGVIDPASHTFKVRVAVGNSALKLRPGMFAQVRIQTADAAGGSATASYVLPELAVQEVNGRPVVFIAGSTPGSYVVRPVTIGSRAGSGTVVVTGGLRTGERVVTRGAFQLKSELTKASFSEGD